MMATSFGDKEICVTRGILGLVVWRFVAAAPILSPSYTHPTPFLSHLAQLGRRKVHFTLEALHV